MADSLRMLEAPSPSNENLHLQLCINDLLYPTEKSEILLEALTATQLEKIEKTINKIKTKKQFLPKQTATAVPTTTTTANPMLLQHDWTLIAAQIAKALTDTVSSAAQSTKLKLPKPQSPAATGTASDKSPSQSTSSIISTTDTIDTTADDTNSNISTPCSSATVTNHELRTEVRDGVEWVSFVYSHHRVLRRYCIRTDIEQVDLNQLDESFKDENCVYPRANLPREEYKGNRWAYETECNTLGWKLSYLNPSEIAGKRGLIQRAVDSYRNRYPSMRSRRVARQEKLLKGTLRKRKQSDCEEPEDEEQNCTSKKIEYSLPKTVSIDDGFSRSKCRIRINVDSVSLDSIDMEFRKANCIYPRAMGISQTSPFASQQQLEEVRCNELAWKLAWLNPKQLANRKSLLQRVLNVYRNKFMPGLNTHSNNLNRGTLDLTIDSFISRKSNHKIARLKLNDDNDDENESQHSGSADSLDDCISPTVAGDGNCSYAKTISLNDLMLPGFTAASCTNGLAFEAQSIFGSSAGGNGSCRLSISSNSSSSNESNISSHKNEQSELNDILIKDCSSMFDLYTDSSAICEYEQSEYIKIEDYIAT